MFRISKFALIGIALLAAVSLVFTGAAAQAQSACMDCHAKETPTALSMWTLTGYHDKD